jgi:polyhydroxyalkanoate synthesis repressor PhaR
MIRAVADEGGGRHMRVIKRYSNRKLYDTHDSRYVTLEQLAELVRQGEEIRVVDKTTDKDLTSATLAQIIFEEEKKAPKLPVERLRQIIRTGLEGVMGQQQQPQQQ